jgi:flagellar motor switch protein FliN
MAEEIEFAPLEGPAAGVGPAEEDLHHLHDVPVELSVELGRTRMTIGETLKLGPGSVVSLNRLAGEPVDLLVNGKPIAHGEVVVIDEEFGLRITEVVSRAGQDAGAPESPEAAAADAAPMPDDVVAYLGDPPVNGDVAAPAGPDAPAQRDAGDAAPAEEGDLGASPQVVEAQGEPAPIDPVVEAVQADLSAAFEAEGLDPSVALNGADAPAGPHPVPGEADLSALEADPAPPAQSADEPPAA